MTTKSDKPAVGSAGALPHNTTPPTVGIECRVTAVLGQVGEPETPGDDYFGDGGTRTHEEVVLGRLHRQEG